MASSIPIEKLVRPALVWDVRRLRALDDVGAESFLAAFDASPLMPAKRESGDPNALEIAAEIVRHVRSGSGTQALDLYSQLSNEPWTNVLGTCIRAWAPSNQREADIQSAKAALGELEDPDLRPRVLAKLAGFAYDANLFPLAEDLLNEAVTRSEDLPRLRTMLEFALHQFTGSWPKHMSTVGMPDDQLVDQHWIDGESLDAARTQLSEMLIESASSPWFSTFRMGRTQLDVIVAAEMQATWAGAIWDRKYLRKQAGAQILLSGSRGSERSAEGLMYWILGGGEKRKIVEFVEPQLDPTEIASVVEYFMQGEQRPAERRQILSEICVALWDSIPSELIDHALAELLPAPQAHVFDRETIWFWRAIADRDPELWEPHFLALEPDQQASVAAGLYPGTTKALSRRALEVIVKVAPLMPGSDAAVDNNPILVQLVARKCLGTELGHIELTGLRPEFLVELADVDRAIVPDDELRAAASQLQAAILKSIDDAREGKMGFGGTSAESTLGRIVVLLGGDALGYIEPLQSLIQSPWCSGESRLSAMNALGYVGTEIGLSTATYEAIRSSPTQTPSFAISPIGPDLLEVTKLLALSAQLTNEDEAALLAFGRHDDARVRQIAINAAGFAYRRAEGELLAHVLVGGLFDPEPSVVERSLRELTKGVPPDLEPVVTGRLEILGSRFPREVRIETAKLARKMSGESKNARSQLAEFVARASEDKSFRVRRAAVDEHAG